uniref:Uncharacterized protein n=1 Tax=Siphoviridae sp. ctB3v5 TaxID=2826186 RepID=A0A8S5M9Q9_9CAUD|nr:MAG TPA: hypothetical protein [Siphoviridae sp. ctB3v5]
MEFIKLFKISISCYLILNIFHCYIVKINYITLVLSFRIFFSISLNSYLK